MENISNIKEILKSSALKYGDKTAYILKKENISFSKLMEDVNCLGTGLLNLGLKDKKVAIISENRYEWELSYLSVICGVGVIVPIDKTLPFSEIERIVKVANVKAVICSNNYEEHILESKSNEKVEYVISMDKISDSENVLSLNQILINGKEQLKKGDNSYINTIVKDSQVAQIIFTSGTTDTSKAVMLTQKNIYSNIISSASVIDMTDKDIVLSVLPLNHVLEGLFSFLLSIYNGAKRTFCTSTEDILTDIKSYNVTVMCGVPALYRVLYSLLADEEKVENITRNINFFFCAGAPLNEDLKEKYKTLGITLLQGYGLTETSSAVALESKKNQKKNTVGKVIPNLDVKIENGEIKVKGDTIMLGYYNNEKSTKETLSDGWLSTGDIGSIDKEGYISITGRKKEVIVLKNGKKIFPSEIEEVINKIDGVKESIVYPLENKESGEIALCAKIVCNDEDKNLIENRIQKLNLELPEYKIIRNVVLTGKELIKNSSGKIDRRKELDIITNNLQLERQNDLNSKESIIKGIVSSQLNINADKIDSKAHLVLRLGADSLDKVAIILKVEKEFNIKIPKEERKNISSIDDILKYIEKRKVEIKNGEQMVDLHTHTNHSDGTDSVEELLQKAEEKGVEILSITDHDQIGAYIEIDNNPDIRKKFSGKIVPGVELKTHYKGTSIEVLGYGIDYKLLKINTLSDEELQRKYLEKLKSVLDKYGFKYDSNELYIDFNNPKKHWAAFTVATEILRHKENEELVKKVGAFDTTSFYRVHQSNKNSVFYVDESENYEDINTIIENIHNANGLAFLAHGYIYPFENKDKSIEEILKTTKIDGIECQHPLFTQEEKQKAIKLADKYHKYKSGGTDYHARNKPDIELVTGKNGNVHVTYEFVKEWIDKCKTI